MYDKKALLDGIEACKNNIVTFEDAIGRERDTIKEYYFMIDTIERKEREAAAVIHIKDERDGD
jgi:ribosomal protein S4E